MNIQLARLAMVPMQLFDLGTSNPFWVDHYDHGMEYYAKRVALVLENVPGVYDGRSGYSTGAHRGRLPFPKWVHPDWRGPGNTGWEHLDNATTY